MALLGVIGFHLLFIEKKILWRIFLFPNFLYLGQSGVDLFFVISGFIMVTVTKRSFHTRWRGDTVSLGGG